ncbi:outer membrane lipoprotein [Porticoccus sp.]
MSNQSIRQKYSLYMLALVLSTLVVSGCDSRSEVAEEPTQIEEASGAEKSVRAEEPASAPPKVVCQNCGTVVSITPMALEGSGSGVGAVAGAVVGGLLGNQVGGGSGKKVATVVGAVGGAFAGNEIEKRTKQQAYYDVLVELDAGGTQTVSVGDAQYLAPGTKVRVSGNNIELL